MTQNPFENIESAHLYVRLLVQQVQEVEATVAAETASLPTDDQRRIDAFRLVAFKLRELNKQLSASSRTLNDLRALRRLLLSERGDGRGEETAFVEAEDR